VSRALLHRLLALLLVLLAASPFTAPFAMHYICDVQYKDASSSDRIATDVAVTPILPGLLACEAAWAAAIAPPARRVERHRATPTVLRL
jgi:hypothetical protein